MSKKKDESMAPAEEIIEETIPEAIEEVKEEDTPTETPKKEEPKVDVESFIDRKLRVINELPNKAQAKFLAERVLRQRERKG